MKISLVMILILGSSVTTGCARLNSIYRPLNIGSVASGVAIDAKQRAIFSAPISYTSAAQNGAGSPASGFQPQVVICAEPSPDALSAYLNSVGATADYSGAAANGAAPEVKGKLANVMAETAASIGLRTQSIQLLRDQLFANCLAYLNGAVGQDEFYALQRRNQNFTLGLLAIEQLTGPLKADQVALSTSGAAGTGSANTDKEQEDVEAAQTKMNDAQTAYDTKKLELDSLQKNVAEQGKKINTDAADLAKLKKTLNPDQPTKMKIAEAEEALKAENSALESIKADLESKKIEVAEANRSLGFAKSSLTQANQNLVVANTKVKSEGAANAQIARSGGPAAQITDRVAKSVTYIVDAVLKASGLVEACNSLLATPPNVNDPSYPAFNEAVSKVCPSEKVIKEAERARKSENPERAKSLLNTL